MLVASYDELKDANTRSPLAFPIFWVGVESLQHIKGLGSIVELAHLETSINVHVSIKTDAGLLLYVHVCVCLTGGGGRGAGGFFSSSSSVIVFGFLKKIKTFDSLVISSHDGHSKELLLTEQIE